MSEISDLDEIDLSTRKSGGSGKKVRAALRTLAASAEKSNNRPKWKHQLSRWRSAAPLRAQTTDDR